jgi:chromosome segregation ATPase
MCHSKAKDLQASLAAAAKKVVTRSAADVATEGHNNALAKANTQRLQAEAALLRAQVRKVDESSTAGLKSLTERRQELAELERGIIAEVKNLTERMSEAKNRSARMKAEAEAAQGSEDEHLAETSALQERIRGLSNRVSPVVYSAIEAENAALGDELHQATSLLMISKASEASAYAAFQQADAEVDGQRETAKAAAESVEDAREEGRRQLEEALKEARANRAKAEEQLAKAMDALQATCKPKWDERKQEKDAELGACKQVDEEYAVVAAQLETLKQTLKAQETVEAAVE